MSSNPHASVLGRLNAAQLVIANSLDEAEIQSIMTGYGYPPEALQEALSQYDAAAAAVQQQELARSAQETATHEAVLAERSARDAYQALAKVARAVLQQDKHLLSGLGLTGREPATASVFVEAAKALFANAAVTAGIADHGFDAARLKAEGAKILAFDKAKRKQEAAKGIAQQATEKRDAVLEQLDAWRAQYVKIARVALRADKQLLERLGVPARTSKTAAQVAASKKKSQAKDAVG